MSTKRRRGGNKNKNKKYLNKAIPSGGIEPSNICSRKQWHEGWVIAVIHEGSSQVE
jgi:hypothetical protein